MAPMSQHVCVSANRGSLSWKKDSVFWKSAIKIFVCAIILSFQLFSTGFWRVNVYITILWIYTAVVILKFLARHRSAGLAWEEKRETELIAVYVMDSSLAQRVTLLKTAETY